MLFIQCLVSFRAPVICRAIINWRTNILSFTHQSTWDSAYRVSFDARHRPWLQEKTITDCSSVSSSLPARSVSSISFTSRTRRLHTIIRLSQSSINQFPFSNENFPWTMASPVFVCLLYDDLSHRKLVSTCLQPHSRLESPLDRWCHVAVHCYLLYDW